MLFLSKQIPIIRRINIETFLELRNLPVLDVRSPGEYTHAHIPGAYNLALFSDDERKVVGTTYKQRSREQAIKTGLDYFGPKMRAMVEQVEGLLKKKKGSSNSSEDDNHILVHCWRGGMRSGAVAWLLDLYGFKVSVLEGGYKSYRNKVLAEFEKEREFKILGGYTGSGKTHVLRELAKNNQPIIDLEGLASHRGSAFGALGQPPQPSQEMFENKLAEALWTEKRICWLEDESQRIGVLNIPHPLWNIMRRQPVFFLDIPFEDRLNNIEKEYGEFDAESLSNSILRIQKRLGPLETKTALAHLQEGNVKECFRILLAYYDKHYLKGFYNRENHALLNKIPCSTVDTLSNTQKLLV